MFCLHDKKKKKWINKEIRILHLKLNDYPSFDVCTPAFVYDLYNSLWFLLKAMTIRWQEGREKSQTLYTQITNNKVKRSCIEMVTSECVCYRDKGGSFTFQYLRLYTRKGELERTRKINREEEREVARNGLCFAMKCAQPAWNTQWKGCGNVCSRCTINFHEFLAQPSSQFSTKFYW